MLEGDRGELRFAVEASAVRLENDHWMRTIRLRVGLGMFGKAVAERAVEVTGDYLADHRFEHTTQTDAFAHETGLRSFVVAPLVAGDAVFGALGVYDRSFAGFYRALVRGGEDSGALPKVLQHLADYLEAREALSTRDDYREERAQLEAWLAVHR